MNDLSNDWGVIAVAIAIIVSFFGVLVFDCVYPIPEFMQQPVIDVLFVLSGLVTLVAGNYFVAMVRALKNRNK